MPIDPQVEAFVQQFNEQGVPPFYQMTVPEARDTAKLFIDLQGDAEEVAEVRTEPVEVDGGTISVRIYRPHLAGRRLPLIVYFHGGGWVIGDCDVVDRPCRSLSNAAGAVVASVEYRRAPESPFPVPVEDCYAATVWLALHAERFGADPRTLTVMGDSAGGNLAAAVALMARDRGSPAIARQVLLYPVTSPAEGTPFASYAENADGYLLTAADMRWFWTHYLRSAADGRHPYASPLAAEELAELPRAYIAVCEFDPLRDEGLAYAERLREAGVAVTLRKLTGSVHGIFWMIGVLDLGRDLLADVAAVIRDDV